MGLPMDGDALVPLVDARQDTGMHSIKCSIEDLEPLTSYVQGTFTKALVQAGPGKTLLGFGSLISWNEFAALWGKTYEATCRYKRIDRKVLETAVPGCIGEELADMFEYIGEFGYDGRDPSVVYPDNVSTPHLDFWLLLTTMTARCACSSIHYGGVYQGRRVARGLTW